MSEVDTKAKLEKFLENRKLSPTEYEKAQIDREFTKGEYQPLDVAASLFFMYNPRLKGQLNFMSLKQLKVLMVDLAGCEYNADSEVNKLLVLAKPLNLNGLRRTIATVIESPLQEGELNLLNAQEQKLFTFFDGLLANKFFSCLKSGLELKSLDSNAVNDLDDMIKHKIDTQSWQFRRREMVEKDAFSTASKVLSCKFLMVMMTQREIEEKELKEKEKENGI